MNITKFLKSSFLIENFRWLLLYVFYCATDVQIFSLLLEIWIGILSELYQFNLQNLQIQPPDVFYEKTVNLLRVQSCNLYHNKCMIASVQITSTEIFAFIAVLVFKLLSRKSRKTEKSIETAKK